MGITFKTKDVIHKIPVKFVKAYLPSAKKPYNIRAVRQRELDLHEIASKAEVYNMTTSPAVIEQGLIAGLELMAYLVADGYRIRTPLFNLDLRMPGEYSGHETSLNEGQFPVARLQATHGFRDYLKEKVTVEFAGHEERTGLIAEVMDESTGLVSTKMTRGSILTIQGYGLKISSDKEHESAAGVFFCSRTGTTVKASVIPLNKPRMIKVIVPQELKTGVSYTITIGTMSAVSNSAALLKDIRTVSSGFSLSV